MFFFVCGQTNFSKPLKGYENIRTLCFNCQNWNATVILQRPTFTVCYIPILPHTIHGYKDVYCNTCHYTQPLETRPELIAQAEGKAPPHQGGPPGGQGPPPQQGYPQQGPPPPQGQQGYPQPPPGYPQYNQNQQKAN